MSFTVDKQTLDDLQLLGKFRPQSIYSLFNKVQTAGGERMLEEMFHQPLTSPATINERSSIIRYFQDQKPTFPFRHEPFRFVENYLGSGSAANIVTMFYRKMMASFVKDEQYQQLLSGLTATIDALCALKDLLQTLNIPFVQPAAAILADKRLAALPSDRTLSLMEVAHYDKLLRHEMRDEMEVLLQVIYQLDVYIAVSKVAHEKGLSYAKALPASANIFSTTALRHPALEKGIANPLTLDAATNMLFLTGANMAGKSTFMKAFGIAVYLAHMGFPVAAHDLHFSVRDGLYSSINVPDNLQMGYSHFYAEVLRVKQVALEVSSGKNMIVIFDELFKGTNVRDAYDATLAVTAAFAKFRNCGFIISTHIIEAGEVLQEQCPNVQFGYMPTIMEGNVPRYPYTLTKGITSDRQGMTIIENEKIIELLQ